MALPANVTVTEFVRKPFRVEISARGVLKFWAAFDVIDDQDNVTSELDLSDYSEFWMQCAGPDGSVPIAKADISLATGNTVPGDSSEHEGMVAGKMTPTETGKLQDAGLVEGLCDIFGLDGDGDRQHIADGYWVLNKAVTRDFS